MMAKKENSTKSTDIPKKEDIVIHSIGSSGWINELAKLNNVVIITQCDINIVNNPQAPDMGDGGGSKPGGNYDTNAIGFVGPSDDFECDED